MRESMKCKDCVHAKEDGVNSYFGGGLYWVNYCSFMPHRLKLVDAEVDRECPDFQKAEKQAASKELLC